MKNDKTMKTDNKIAFNFISRITQAIAKKTCQLLTLMLIRLKIKMEKLRLRFLRGHHHIY